MLRFVHLVIFHLKNHPGAVLVVQALVCVISVQEEYRQRLKAKEDQVEDAEARFRNVEWLLQEKVEELREQVSTASCPSSTDAPPHGPGRLCFQNLEIHEGTTGRKCTIFL